MRIIITRPAEDAAPLAAALQQRGHETFILPLLKIEPRRGVLAPAQKWQALCVTSANGLRAYDGPLDPALPVFAVGAQSAAAARARGFVQVESEGGDVTGLAAHVTARLDPAAGPLLYISGAETSGDLAGTLQRAGFSVTRLVTYDAVPLPLAAIPKADMCLLYSPRSAKLWVRETQRLKADTAQMCHICLSEQVARALPEGYKKKFLSRPDAAAMLREIDLMSKSE